MAHSTDRKLRERFINLLGLLYLTVVKKKTACRKNSVGILNYHKISGRSFAKHLKYFQKHYQIISPPSFQNWLDDGEEKDKPCVVLTFDDGYMSFYEEIYPILKEAGISVFMFLPTGYIGNSGYLWFDELRVALRKTQRCFLATAGKTFFLRSRIYRSDHYGGILRNFASLDRERRREVCRDALEQLNVDLTEEDMVPYRVMGWPQILEMDRSGLVVFGSHTVNHPNLTGLSNEALRFELKESKRLLEHRLEKPIGALAYPYGGEGSFDTRILDESRKAGYSYAFTTIQGTTEHNRTDRFALKRIMLFDYQNEGAVAFKLHRWGT